MLLSIGVVREQMLRAQPSHRPGQVVIQAGANDGKECRGVWVVREGSATWNPAPNEHVRLGLWMASIDGHDTTNGTRTRRADRPTP